MTSTAENHLPEALAPFLPDISVAQIIEEVPTPSESQRSPRRSRRYVIGQPEDLPDGGRLAVKIGRREIAVLNVGGELFALNERCPHQFAPLSHGRIQGTVICDETTGWKTEWAHDNEILVCPGHGMEFNIRTGKCLGFDFSIKTFKVEIDGTEIVLYL